MKEDRGVQEALGKSEPSFRLLVESVRDYGIFLLDPAGRVASWNRGAEHIKGYTEEEVRGRHFSLFYTPEDRERNYPEHVLAGAAREGRFESEGWRVRKDGSRFWANVVVTALRDEQGKLVGFAKVTRDLSERKHAEEEREALRERERRLRRELEAERGRLQEIFMQVPALISVTQGPEHRIVLVNPVYERMAGGRELVGKTLREALPELEGQGYFEMRDRVYATGKPHLQNEARVLADLDGDGELEEVFLNFATQPLFDPDGKVSGILTFGIDVTEQVRARQLVEAQTAALEKQAEALRHQAVRLEETQVDVEIANDELQRANEELVARTQEAERARAEAEAANRAKSDFLATMSHELRTPINAIIGYGDLLDMGIAGSLNEAQRAQVERIRVSSQHLLRLIEEILDLAKIEAGRTDVAREPIRVGDVVESSIALVEPQAAERRVALTYQCTRDANPVFLGDEDRVRQIVLNLLSNALKFTEPGDKIAVTCDTVSTPGPDAAPGDSGPWVRVRVEDTGIGIPAEKIESVFEPFVQVESGTTRTRGGTGLGLSISRQLARLMGGDVTLASRLGEGSCFTLWLPAAPAHTDPQEERRLPTDLLANAGSAPGLANMGEVLQTHAEAIMDTVNRRLRADPLVSGTAGLDEVELEDHQSAFLTAVGQALVVLGRTDGRPDLMKESSEIQSILAERHGAQRARLGWAETALRREAEILREEVEAALSDAIQQSAVEEEVVRNVLAWLLQQAEEASLRGLRLGRTPEPA